MVLHLCGPRELNGTEMMVSEKNEQSVTVKKAKSTFRVGGKLDEFHFDQEVDFGNTHVALNTETGEALIYVDDGDGRQFTDGDKGVTSGGRHRAGSILINGKRENAVKIYDGKTQIGSKLSFLEGLVSAAVRDAFADGAVTVSEQRELTGLATQLVNQKNPSKGPREH